MSVLVLMASYYTRAKVRSDLESEMEQSNLAASVTTTTISTSSDIVGPYVESTRGLESMATELAGPTSTHPSLS